MRFKLLIACLAFALSTTTRSYGSAMADDSLANVLDRFTASIKASNYVELNTALDPALKFRIPHAGKVMTFNRSAMVNDIKARAGMIQKCDINYSILGNSNEIVLARVDLSYDNIIKHDYLVIQKDREENWKITEVYELFEDVHEPIPTDDIYAHN